MIPFWMKMKVPRKDRKPVTLYIPVFLAGLLILILFVLILPIWILASIVLLLAGYGWSGFIVPGLIFYTLWHLQGLEIDVESKNEMVYMKFI